MNMIGNDDRRSVRQAIRSVLAAHYACDEQDLIGAGVTVIEARERPGRMRFPIPIKPLSIVTMGAGVVVSALPERIPWLRTLLGGMERDTIFSAPVIGELAQYVAPDEQELAGPTLRYACSRHDLRPVVDPRGVVIDLIEGNRVADLYQYHGFGMALSYPRDHVWNPRPDVLATVATRAGEIVGIAGASADTDDLWQIGVEVVAEARGCGIGRALVGHLSHAALNAGKIPYYSTAISNIGSRAIALSLGYWPVWTDLYVRDRSRE